MLQIFVYGCVLNMLQIFSEGREPEVEADGIRVVVAFGKREVAIYLKRRRRRWRMLVNVVTLYKNCVPAAGARMAYIQ